MTRPDLPCGDLVGEGLQDLSRGIESPAALLVSIGAPRLRSLGIDVSARIQRLIRALGVEADAAARVYFTGATAVLYGWRSSAIAVDLKVVPDRDRLYRALPTLKERLEINLELAAPHDFIPVREGWEDRSPFIGREGPVSFHHFDLYAQALSKVERGHAQDLSDVSEMLSRGLIDRETALAYFEAIEPKLYRYPAIDAASFRRDVVDVFGETGSVR